MRISIRQRRLGRVTGPSAVNVALGLQPEITLVTGPVFFSTALRDAVGIKFGQFCNQMDSPDVATAVNAKVKGDVVSLIECVLITSADAAKVSSFALSAG